MHVGLVHMTHCKIGNHGDPICSRSTWEYGRHVTLGLKEVSCYESYVHGTGKDREYSERVALRQILGCVETLEDGYSKWLRIFVAARSEAKPINAPFLRGGKIVGRHECVVLAHGDQD